jgi:hypothetical protein
MKVDIKDDEPQDMGSKIIIAGGSAILLLIVIWGITQGTAGAPRPKPDPWPGWTIIGWVLLALFALVLICGTAYALARMWLSLRATWHQFEHQRRVDALAAQESESAAENGKVRGMVEAVHVPPWAEHGRAGLVILPRPDGTFQIVNLDAEAGPITMRPDGSVERALSDELTVAQMQGRLALESERARAGALPGLTTLTNSPRLASSAAPGVEPPAPALPWPGSVYLRDLAPGAASLHELLLGVTMGDNGRQQPITAALSELVHIAVGGSSGWGKSVFLRSLALQLATAGEPCQLAMIDLEGVTFAPFATCGRLLWPLAETESGALAIMATLVDEMERRKALYAGYPGVDSLGGYNLKVAGNAQGPAEPLVPLVCLVDEATALLADRSVHNAARSLALRARKYGVWLVLGGQDWRAIRIDSGLSNQLSGRIQFRANSAAQSRVLLGDGCAAELDVKGRAYALLPGRSLLQLQAPMVTVADIGAALAGQSGPTSCAPPVPPDAEQDDTEQRILDLAGQGLSRSAIERQVFGYTGGQAFETVRRVLGDTGPTTTSERPS